MVASSAPARVHCDNEPLACMNCVGVRLNQPLPLVQVTPCIGNLMHVKSAA